MTSLPRELTVAVVTERFEDTAMSHMGIQIDEVSDYQIAGSLTVDERHVQPMGLLHGGISCVFAETLGSALSNVVALKNDMESVGLEINANHIRAVKKGERIFGLCRFLHRGRRTHVLQIEIQNEQQKLVCISRLTMALRPKT